MIHNMLKLTIFKILSVYTNKPERIQKVNLGIIYGSHICLNLFHKQILNKVKKRKKKINLTINY